MLNKTERLSQFEKQIKLKRKSNNNDRQYNAQVIVSATQKRQSIIIIHTSHLWKILRKRNIPF